MLTLLSWNIAHRPEAWRVVADSKVDLALLQEACEPATEFSSRLDTGEGAWQTGGPAATRRRRTALVRCSPRLKVERISTRSLPDAGADDLPVSLPGTLAAGHVEDPDTGGPFTVASMYAAWERPHGSTKSQWIYADASAHRLVSDLSVLVGRERGHRIIVAGDLNILHGHGEYRSAYWAARYKSIFDRFALIGLEFVGPQSPNGRQAEPWPEELPLGSMNVPTFHTNRQSPATATRQLDFVFASKDIAHRIATSALNSPEEWGPSDHCRVRIEVA